MQPLAHRAEALHDQRLHQQNEDRRQLLMRKHIRSRCSASNRRTILVGTSQAVQMMPSTSVGRSSNVQTCMRKSEDA